MSEIFASLMGYFIPVAHAAIAGAGKTGVSSPTKTSSGESGGGSFVDTLETF